MRRLITTFTLGLGLVLAIVAPMVGSTSVAHADARSEARTHYQAGVRFYNANNYQAAIREFSAAQSLAPADLNNYNIALCYDKMGDAESAIRYYRDYLDKVPNTPRRAEIEASISRLDAAAKSAAAKRAEEERRAAEAKRKADEAAAKKAAEEAAAKKKAEEAAAKKKAEEPTGPTFGPQPVGTQPTGPQPVGVGSTGTPSTGQVSPTGDAQLDRVQQIDINQIRDQRIGGAASGLPNRENTTPGATSPRAPSGANLSTGAGANGEVGAAGQPDDRNGTAPMANTSPTNPPNAAGGNAATPNTNPGEPADKKATPVYKKWWFWAVVAVSAYVVYSIATDGSKSQTGRELPGLMPQAPAAPGGGVALFRF